MSLTDNIRRAKELARERRGDYPPPSANRPSVAKSLPCVHLGQPTGNTTPCTTCGSGTRLKTFDCSIHGTCSVAKNGAGVKSCVGCGQYEAAPLVPISTRNLLYYVYPVAGNGVWQTCIDQLLARIELFNGKIVLLVAQDPPEGRQSPYGIADGPRFGRVTDSTPEVVRRLGTHSRRIEVIEGKNDPNRWESAHHLQIFSKTISADPSEATLYAHAKGVTRPANHVAHRWRVALYETLCDHWPVVAESLSDHLCTGSFKKIGRGWPARESQSAWHYSGSWFWFRNRELYQRNWKTIDRFWAGIESYPSLHFKRDEAGCVFHEAPVRKMNLYDEGYFAKVVGPELARFRKVIISKRDS